MEISHAINISVNLVAPGQGFGDNIRQADGSALPANALFRIGTFVQDPDTNAAAIEALLVAGSAVSNLNNSANFLTFGTVARSGFDDSGILNFNFNLENNMNGRPIFLVAYNHADATSATQVGVFRFYDDAGIPTVFDDFAGADTEIFPTLLLESEEEAAFATPYFGKITSGGALSSTIFLASNAAGLGITSPNPPDAVRNEPYSYTITANNGATSFSADGLPPGLSVNATTGVISGTPTSSGTSNVTLRANNLLFVEVTRNVTLTVNEPVGLPPVITPPGPQTAYRGVPFSLMVPASNDPTGFDLAGAPAGFSISEAGVITGTTGAAAGTYNLQVVASNAGGASDPATIPLTLASPSVTPSSATVSGTVGTAITPVTVSVTPPDASPTFARSSGPDGLSINPGTGTVTGTPNAVPDPTAGTMTIIATFSAGVTAETTVAFTIATPAPVLLAPAPAALETTRDQEFTLVLERALNGAQGPITYRQVAGDNLVKLGINLSQSNDIGTLRGKPQELGIFSASFVAVNPSGTSNVLPLTITVHNNFPQIHGGRRLSFRLNQSFTQLPRVDYNWLPSGAQGLYLSGNLPPGITNRNPEGAGFSGTPTVVGLFSSTITAFNMDFTGARLATSAPVQIRVNRGTQALYGMDGNLDGGAGGRALAGGVSSYLPDRFGRVHSSARVASASGLVHTNATTDVVDSFSLSLWFKMPETPVPPEGWYLLRGNPAVEAISLKLIPSGSGSGVRLQVENLSSRDNPSWVQGLFLDDHFTTPEIKGWESGTGWHHLVFTGGNYYSRPMMYLDGVAIENMVWQFSHMYFQYCFDLNNFSIGGDPWSPTTAAAFPGEIDEMGLFDIPLLITDYSLLDESFWLENRNLLNDPTVESLYLHGLQGQPGGILSSFSSQYSYGGHHRILDFKVKKIFDLEVGGFGVGGLDSNGRPVFKGEPSFRDLTDDPAIWVPAPAIVSGLEELRFGVGFELGLKKGGQVVSRLWSSYGSSNQIIPHASEVRTAQGVAVAANDNTAMVLKNDGSLDVWHPVTVPTSFHPEPSAWFLGQTNVPLGATNLVAVAAGSLHCLALSWEGRVWAWGDNSAGQCDVPAAALQDVVKIAADGVLSMALTRQGRVVVWGIQEESIGSPDHFQGKYRFIDVGNYGSLGALTEDGRLVTWMRGSTEQLAHWTALGLPQLLPEYARVQGITRFKMGNSQLGDTGTYLPVILQASNVPSWKLRFPLKLVSPLGVAFARNLALEAELPSGQSHTFEAIGLPEGVTLDAESGLLSAPAGLPVQARTVTVIVRNPNGMDRRSFSLQGIQPGGIDLMSAHPQESLGPVLLARVFLPQGWQLNPLPPIAAYEAREASAGWEIWSRSGLDYENLEEQQVVVSVAATDPLGQIRTADLTVVLSDNPWEDADGDSIRQYYEEIYGSSDFSVDTDGDGLSDWQEIEAGSSPKNPLIKPGQASVAGDMTTANFRFRFHAPLGQWVKVQCSTNLVEWNEESTAEHPTELLFGFEGDGEMWEAEFPVSGQKRFYRTLRTQSRTLAR